MPNQKIGLDNPVFAGRLRGHNTNQYKRREVVDNRPRYISGVYDRFDSGTRVYDQPKQAAVQPVPVQMYVPQAAASEPSLPPVEQDIVRVDSQGDVRNARYVDSFAAVEPVANHQPLYSQSTTELYSVPDPVNDQYFESTPDQQTLQQNEVIDEQFQPKQPRTTLRFTIKKPSTSKLLVAAAVIVFMVGIGVSIDTFRTNRRASSQVQAMGQPETSDNVSDVPDETTPPDDAYKNYAVSAELPRYIKIPKLGVDSIVRQLSVKANNELMAPSNVFDAGWYKGSSRPGEKGAMLVDGHVSGPTKHGVFYDLKKLVAGDEIKIERGDGQIFTYKVVSMKRYDADNVNMGEALTAVTPDKPGLNLITCTGKYDSGKQAYAERLVVFAALK